MSVVQVMGGGRGNLATDRTPFYGIKLPDEVKKSVAILKQIDQDGFRKILKRKKGFSSCFFAINRPSVITFFFCVVVVQYLETGILEEEQFLKMTSAKLTEENLRILFAAIMVLLRSALRQPTLKSEVSMLPQLFGSVYVSSLQIFVEDLKQIK